MNSDMDNGTRYRYSRETKELSTDRSIKALVITGDASTETRLKNSGAAENSITTFEIQPQPVNSAAFTSSPEQQNETGASSSSYVRPTHEVSDDADEDFHFTIEIPVHRTRREHTETSTSGNNDIFYLDTPIPENSGEEPGEELFEVETRSDLDSGYFGEVPVVSPVHSATNSPKTETAYLSASRSVNTPHHTAGPLTIDEAIEQLVSSEPFLSESEMYHLLKGTSYTDFKLTRRTLKKQLRIIGLENSYQRFRTFMAGLQDT